MTRMHNREFAAVSAGQSSASASYQVLPYFESVELGSGVIPFLKAQIKSPSRVRGGLLFGYSEADVLHVLLAGTAGVSSWYGPGERTVLDIDPRFALGWGEALLSVAGTRLDWVGNWVTHPNGQLKTPERNIRRFRSGFRSGLIDDRSILLVVGYMDGMLRFRAINRGADGVPTVLELTESSETLTDRLQKRPSAL